MAAGHHADRPAQRAILDGEPGHSSHARHTQSEIAGFRKLLVRGR